MSDRERRVLVTLLVVLLPVVSFLGGYFTNDYVEFLRGRKGVGVVAAADGADLSLFNEAWGLVQANFIGEMPEQEQLSYAIVRGAMSSLDDRYSIFLEPVVSQGEQESLRGNFGGIGATIGRNEAGEAVLTPIPGNPAAAAGIEDGDVLLAVDGVEITADMAGEEIAQMVRGEKGTIVVLTVRHPNQTEPVEIPIERGDILIPSVIARMLPEAPTVGYIQLTRFSGESVQEMEDALNNLQGQGAEGIVLDLRGNGGGLVESAVDIADEFISTGDLLYQESKQGGEYIYKATPTGVALTIPVVVLVDGGTASAAEILAGALQDHDRATLLGTQTFGKGSVQLIFDLSDGSSIHITSARWYTPDRHQIDQQGLTPTVVVQPTADGRDVQLEEAINLLQTGES